MTRAAEKESLVAQTKELVLSHAAIETDPFLLQQTVLAHNETAALRALWQYDHDCT